MVPDKFRDITRTYEVDARGSRFEIATDDYKWLTGELNRLRNQQQIQQPQAPQMASGQVAITGVIGLVLGIIGTIVWSQNRCYRRYQRLCHRWFADDPGGELGCLERAEDVCY